MKKILKASLLAAGAMVTIVTPVAAAVSCGSSSSDLTKTIVVLSPSSKDAAGNVSYPLDKVWDTAFEQLKQTDSNASKYTLKKLHIADYGNDSYEKLSTVGVTGASMPDIWFFPSDKLHLLNDENKAIEEVSQHLKDQLALKSGLSADKLTFEQIDGKNFGARFKTESVNMWVNVHRLAETFPGEHGAHDFLAACATGTTTDANYVSAANPDGINLPSTTIDFTTVKTVQDLFKAIEGTVTGDDAAQFRAKHDNVAKFMSSQLDIAKIGDVMAAAKSNDSDIKRNLMPVPGENGWPLNGLVYADTIGTPQQGLIWGTKGDLHTKFTEINKGGDFQHAMEAWYKLATSDKITTDTKGTWNTFSNGLQAFTIEGTWAQKSFTDDLPKVYKADTNFDLRENLFAFPLAQVNGHQMRHYSQGWNFGINARNKANALKNTTVENLVAELFSTTVQQKFYDTVENYIPGNMAAKMVDTKPQYVESVIPFILNTDGANVDNKLKVDRTAIPSIYGEADWDKTYGKILAPLKKDSSANVGAKDFNAWASQVTDYLTHNGFKA